MDQIASTLLAFPPDDAAELDNDAYHKAVQLHVARLSKLLKERPKDLATNASQLFSTLNPAVNSLSFLAVLHAAIVPSLTTSIPREAILEKLVTFAMTFDGRQCRYAAGLWNDLVSALGGGQLLTPPVAVRCLASVILRLDPSGSMLTSTHLNLAKIAYETNNILPAIPVIDKNIVFYPLSKTDELQLPCDLSLAPTAYISHRGGLSTAVKSYQILEYDLLCGLMYCDQRDWEKARMAFERVVTYPTREGGVSTIMVEAHKKWSLATLLSTGKHMEAPQLTNGNTAKTYGILSKPYSLLGRAFASDEAHELKTVAEQNSSTWVEDGNVGLVKEVLATYQKWRVLSLQQIYTKISIPEIRQRTKSAETGKELPNDGDVEQLVQNMITQGLLKGAVGNTPNGTKYLTFFSTDKVLSETEFAQAMQASALRLVELRDATSATNYRLSTSKDFIRYSVKDSKRDKLGESLDPTLGFEASVDDEDLMGGLASIG